MEERSLAASKCLQGLKLSLPLLLDTMDGSYEQAYGGWPAGTVVVDIDGKLAYWSPGSARGCLPHDAEMVLEKLLGNAGRLTPNK